MTPDQNQLPRPAEVEYVTKNFAALQGLRIVPAAVVLTIWAASEAGLFSGTVWWFLFGASVVVAAVATPLIGRWYSTQYGAVEPRRQVPASTRTAILVIAVLVLATVVLVSGAFGWMPEVETISASGLILGVALVAFAWMQGPVARQVHPWTHRFGAALAIISVLPLGMLTGEGSHPLSYSGVMPMVVAVFLVVSAVDTHRALDTLMSRGPQA